MVNFKASRNIKRSTKHKRVNKKKNNTTLHSQRNEINLSATATAAVGGDNDGDDSSGVTFFPKEKIIVFLFCFV